MKGLFISFVKSNTSSLEKPHMESAACFDRSSFWKWKQRSLLSARVMTKPQGWVFCLHLQPGDKHLSGLQRRILGGFVLPDISPQSTPSP